MEMSVVQLVLANPICLYDKQNKL